MVDHETGLEYARTSEIYRSDRLAHNTMFTDNLGVRKLALDTAKVEG